MTTLKKDVLWNSFGVTAWAFMSLILLIIVTRINGIEDSGVFSFAFAFAFIVYTIVCYGGRNYQVSDHKNIFSYSDYISLRILMSIIALIITLLFLYFSGYGIYKTSIFTLLVLYRIIDGLSDVFYGILQKENQLYIVGKSLFYKSMAGLVLFTIIDLYTNNLLLSTASLPFSALMFLLLHDIPRTKNTLNKTLKINFKNTKKLMIKSFPMFASIALGLLFANIARYFIEIYHPNMQGYFGIIVMPLSFILLLFSFVLTPAILPLTNAYKNKRANKLGKIINIIISITILGALVTLSLTYLFSVPILNTLFGVDFAKYLWDIMGVVVIGLIISLTTLFTNIALIARKMKPIVVIYLISLIILILLCLLLVPSFNINGAILAYILASSFQLLFTIYYLSIVGRLEFLTKK